MTTHGFSIEMNTRRSWGLAGAGILLVALAPVALVLAVEVRHVPRFWIVGALVAPAAVYGLVRFPSVLVAMFLSAYTFKRAPILEHLPDLTVAFGLLCAVLVVRALVRGRRLPTPLMVFLFALVLLVGSSALRDLTPYGQDKVLRFVTLTVLAMVSMVVLVDDVRRFCMTLAVVGASLSLSAFVLGEATTSGRTEVFGDYLMVARQEGIGFVAAATLGGWWLLPGALSLSGVAVAGARAPFLAALLAPATRFSFRVMVAGLLGALVLLTPMGEPLLRRIDDLSDTFREAALERSVMAFEASPWVGHGPGSFIEWAPHTGYEPMVYPHNLVAETAVEYGVVGLVVVGAFLSLAALAAARRRDPISLLFMYALIGSMVTGDFNANRMLWAFAAFLIAQPASRHR